MKKDLQKLLSYLRDFQDVNTHSSSFLYGEDEDSEMLIEIKSIAKKYKLNF